MEKYSLEAKELLSESQMLNPIASWKFGIQKKLSLFMRLNKRISLKILCVTAVASSKSVEHLDKYAIEI